MLGSTGDIAGPVIGVDVSGFEEDKFTMTMCSRTPGKTQYMSTAGVGSSSYAQVTLNGMLAALGMPSLETIVEDTMTNPDNYSTCIVGITFKGKNRTFKNKVSKKWVLHKERRLDEFNMAMNSMRRWI